MLVKPKVMTDTTDSADVSSTPTNTILQHHGNPEFHQSPWYLTVRKTINSLHQQYSTAFNVQMNDELSASMNEYGMYMYMYIII